MLLNLKNYLAVTIMKARLQQQKNSCGINTENHFKKKSRLNGANGSETEEKFYPARF